MLRSRNYAPSADLMPVVARHYIFSVDLPSDGELIDCLLSETAFVRILLRGDWAAETEPQVWTPGKVISLFGANSRPFRVRVRGGFHIVGVALRPGGWRCLFDTPASDLTDRMVPLASIWGAASDILFDRLAAIDACDDGAIIATVEAAIRGQLADRPPREPDFAMAAFEHIARNDSMIQVRAVCERLGLSARQFERICCATFGMTPKTVLRRSRFLDMASSMRGLSQPSEEQLAALRYADQSHLTREFRRFIGMTPRQFAQTPTPLLTAGLELRNLYKREDAGVA